MPYRIFLFVLSFCALLPAWIVAADLKPSKPEVRKAVIAVVEAQLAAFREGDVQKAYSYAASALRRQTPLRSFVTIVQTNYAEIWANTGAEHGLVRDDGQSATVMVRVTSKTGGASFDFVVLREQNGWRIGSVVRHVTKKKDDV